MYITPKQTTFPREATKYLFKQILPSLDVSDEAHISFVYDLLQKKWGCNTIHQGTEEKLYQKVLVNLKRTAALQGFRFFYVTISRASDKDGEIISFADGDAASVTVCRATDGTIHLFGNYFFR